MVRFGSTISGNREMRLIPTTRYNWWRVVGACVFSKPITRSNATQSRGWKTNFLRLYVLPLYPGILRNARNLIGGADARQRQRCSDKVDLRFKPYGLRGETPGETSRTAGLATEEREAKSRRLVIQFNGLYPIAESRAGPSNKNGIACRRDLARR